MSDILEEVLRDHNDAKKLYYFRKILPIVVGLTIVIVAGMIVNNWYQEKILKENMEFGDIFVKTLDNTDTKVVDEVLTSLYKNNSGNKIGEIAALRRVGVKLNADDTKQAKMLLEEIISSKENITASFARIAWLSLVIDNNDLANQDKDRVQEYLKYFTSEKQEFFGTASLLKSLWYIKNNQSDLAREVLKNLRSIENMPAIIREQAKALLSKIDH